MTPALLNWNDQIMPNEIRKQVSGKYCPRFGQTAVESGFISGAQLQEALACQVQHDLEGKEHRLLGQILFEKEWMSAAQIDQVLTQLLKQMRKEP